MLYNLIITPIETIVEWTFNFMRYHFFDFGVIAAIIGVSIVINFLALPLYNIADDLQEKERNIAKALEPRVKRIKKAFKGNERFMMLSTYYRQNNYHPLYALRSSFSILIQIPFFIAAYHFLSHTPELQDASFWIFNNLGAPDALLHINGFAVNILPILMTFINILSGAVYAKNAPVKEKMQIVAMAVLFLVLLYNSPSGLVIYWILNNVFSLAKNIVKKIPYAKKVLYFGACVVLCVFLFMLFLSSITFVKIIFAFAVIGAMCYPFYKKRLAQISFLQLPNVNKQTFAILFFSCIGITLLCGLVIPASTIATSPAEFAFLGKTDSPLAYVGNSLCIFAGFFIVWPLIIYALFGQKVKKIESFIIFVLFILVLLNVFVFKADYGDVTVLLEFSVEALQTTTFFMLVSFAIYALILCASFVALKLKCLSHIPFMLLAICIAELALGCTKLGTIQKSYATLKKIDNEQISTSMQKEFSLSKTEQNVVILFLDRAINSFIPQFFDTFPELKKQFDGFTYYPNTLSFSNFTVTGSPAMLAGYEYTPEKMNERKDEKLVDKHNEALLVMPKLFADANFTVQVLNPPFANYEWSDGLECYDNYTYIDAKEIEGKHFNQYRADYLLANFIEQDKLVKNGFVDFALVQILPPFLRQTFYGYATRSNHLGLFDYAPFISAFSQVYYLPQMTDFSSKQKTFTFIASNATHDISPTSLAHYQANLEVISAIAKWLDFLKQNDAYDNTRIIIVSDHGRDIDAPCNSKTIAFYSALLMVKDFASSGDVKIDNTFMTNADTIFIAKEGLGLSNVNPFTQKAFVQDKVNGINVYACLDGVTSDNAELKKKTQFKLDKSQAWHVSDDIYKEENWIPLLEWEKMSAAKTSNAKSTSNEGEK